MCWESCFSDNVNEDNRGFLQDLHKIGDDLKRMKLYHRLDHIAFLLDENIADHCNSSESSSSEGSLSWSNELNGRTKSNMWDFQLKIMAILSAMVGDDVYTWNAWYNSARARACEDENGMRPCLLMHGIDSSSYFTYDSTTSSCESDRIENACRLAYFAMDNYNTYYTSGSIFDTDDRFMAVAIMNSDAHLHARKRNNYRRYSPCHAIFEHRYAVGLFNANQDDLKRFASREGNHEYISSSQANLNLVNTIYSCIKSDCCDSSYTFTETTDDCDIATGHVGEYIVDDSEGRSLLRKSKNGEDSERKAVGTVPDVIIDDHFQPEGENRDANI